MREAEGVALSLEQSRKKERALEEEGRRLAEELADALRLVKELQGEQQAVGGEMVNWIHHWIRVISSSALAFIANVLCLN